VLDTHDVFAYAEPDLDMLLHSTPTRASLLTGLYAHNTGLPFPLLAHPVGGIPDGTPLMPELLKHRGRTAAEHVAHQAPQPRPQHALTTGDGAVNVLLPRLFVPCKPFLLQSLQHGEHRRVSAGLSIGHGLQHVADAARSAVP
jgi:hypothetical protein